MEEQKVKTGKFALNYGLLSGLISVVFGVMLYTQKMHYETSTAVIVISIVILASIIFLGVNAFKKANGGYLSISEALKIGVGIALVGAIVSLIYQYVLTTFIEPDFMDKAMELAKPKAMAQNPNMTEEQWQQGVEMQKGFAWVQYPILLIMNSILGLIIGLITGLILKKSKADY
ncbi:DUF4199 domain-containing protein [Flagellimonas okinawensis]|uniref:DUF4199 domain-containing protein n=1 Tax=Flagellimonas okinawensis TaxID=3031324 RepID=A0ABT5XJN9_9FLAO|nr:DUF4199 domain-containing protein [[Muricauda] okinawensis]MDF0706105.1 DUF4199 domain-containing protein [[Muricauda] okinawensis]